MTTQPDPARTTTVTDDIHGWADKYVRGLGKREIQTVCLALYAENLRRLECPFGADCVEMMPRVLDALAASEARLAETMAALTTIRDEYGRVCEEYEICTHVACQSSYGAWAVADQALTAARSAGEGAE